MKLKILFLLLILFPAVFAADHYSYEHAEELKPLIEWRDYGPKAFDEAVEQNKPIFLLLTAPSWCYWCQVYESEDYLFNPAVYKLINEKFIPIYVDADKRQDITRQYLEGGWPSTTVFTPGRERLFGYSGPRPVAFMVSNLEQASTFVNSQGFSTKISYDYQKTSSVIPTQDDLNNMINGYAYYNLQAYDKTHGGFGTGQKFPQGRTLDFSLELYESTGNKQWLDLVENTLKNQYTKIAEIETNYNLFDPVEGGFHRYGTRRDWTPPHYEKMLYDNARLLKAYFHLSQLTDDSLAKEVVEKTDSYIITNWYDEKGGFYGNTDVHGEDKYYGKDPRPADKPRVEKTKYTDWNSEAILTYLYLWQETKDEKYKEIAETSLDFFAKEMVTKKGAYHYKKEDGTKGVRGSLLDNSFLLLAFVEGYEILGKKIYLEKAEQIADYSLENLYDWNSGGFFERNSPDIELYAPGEHIKLTKPNENGVMAYAMLKLYKQTNDKIYLNAGLKTLGSKLNSVGGLDFGYYYVKTAQFILRNNLLAEFNQEKIEQIEKEKQESSWLNELITEKPEEFKATEQGLQKLQGSILLLIIIALLAGLLSFASPCTLPILPAYLAYSFKSSKSNIKTRTFAFFLGLSIVFTLLGMGATTIGRFLKENLGLFSQVAGLAIMFFGIYILLGKGFAGFRIKNKKPESHLSSFLFGAALALGWTPCIGPILVAILLLASTVTSTITGGLLLFAYAVGLAIPLILLSIYLEKLDKKSKLWKIIKGKELKFIILDKEISIHSNNLISGLIFLTLGYLIFSGTLYSFNQYAAASSLQQWVFAIEERLLGFVR